VGGTLNDAGLFMGRVSPQKGIGRTDARGDETPGKVTEVRYGMV